MAGERAGHTLRATALVHEVYLKLSAGDPNRWADSGHFYATAAESMRHLLLDHPKARLAVKRGGGARACHSLGDTLAIVASAAETSDPEQVVALDAAFLRLEKINPQAAAVVLLRFYAGLSIEHTAKHLGFSPATAKRKWAYARTWLYRELSDGKS